MLELRIKKNDVIMALIRVPKFAKKNARQAQRQRNKFSNPPGTTTGLRRARQLQRENRITENTANEIISFLARHHAQLERGEDRRLVAIKLWGGQKDRRFLKYLRRKTG